MLAVARASLPPRGFVDVPDTCVAIPRWTGNSAAPSHLVPRHDPAFVFVTEVVCALAGALARNAVGDLCPVLLTGPAGAGKTRAIEQLAALADAPLVTVGCHGDLRAFDLFGVRVLDHGQMSFSDGPVTLAFRHGWWLNLDEVSATAPGILQALHPILDGARSLLLESGEVVTRAPGFAVFATSNVLGSASENRRHYAGNAATNDATLSRFAVKLQPPLPDEATLRLILTRAGSRDPDRLERAMVPQLARWFRIVRDRTLCDDPEFRYRLTPRELVAMWRMWLTPIIVGGALWRRSMIEVAQSSILHAYSPSEGAAVIELLRAQVGHLEPGPV